MMMMMMILVVYIFFYRILVYAYPNIRKNIYTLQYIHYGTVYHHQKRFRTEVPLPQTGSARVTNRILLLLLSVRQKWSAILSIGLLRIYTVVIKIKTVDE